MSEILDITISMDKKDAEYFNTHNIEILKESIRQLENGQIIYKTMEELEAMAADD